MVFAYLFSAFTLEIQKPLPAAAPAEHYKVFKRRVEKVFADLNIRKDGLFHVKIMKKIGLLPRTELRQIHFFLDRLEERLGAPPLVKGRGGVPGGERSQ
jgi:hypothetical protein